MRGLYKITITGQRKSWHFAPTQRIQNMLAGGVVGLGVIILTAGLLVGGLSMKVSSLNETVVALSESREEIATNNKNLLAEQHRLQNLVGDKIS